VSGGGIQSDFAEVQRNLEETLSKLKETNDQELRRQLLRKMRSLLVEADRMLEPLK
jgi:hypothetical protein